MVHIVTCMATGAADNRSVPGYIANTFTPPYLSTESLDRITSSLSLPHEGKKSYVVTMSRPEKKYQLFPSVKQSGSASVTNSSKQLLDPEPTVLSQSSGNKAEKTDMFNGLRLMMKDRSFARRRKASLSDMAPMTTMHEINPDSPTLPSLHPSREAEDAAVDRPTIPKTLQARRPSHAANSSRELPTIVIPIHNSSKTSIARKVPASHNRSASHPSEPFARFGGVEESPRNRTTPYTPYTPYTPSSAATSRSATSGSSLPTPISGYSTPHESPPLWEVHGSPSPISASSTGYIDGLPLQQADPELPAGGRKPMSAHTRKGSDSGSITERGRQRMKTDGGSRVGASERRNTSGTPRLAHSLPQGWASMEAARVMSQSEISYLRSQALSQVSRFEVLKKADVEKLSTELRHLDDRADQVRQTHTSLRAGRRNLHARICQYLASPRTGQFSFEAVLKQQEALAELDRALDAASRKLDRVESRRSLVRYKLMEHIAAAAVMSTAGVGAGRPTQAADVHTPPRSPVKDEPVRLRGASSPSPRRNAPRVPSVIPEVPGAEDGGGAGAGVGLGIDGQDVKEHERTESIRIYAGNDVYDPVFTLLADLESDFTELSRQESAGSDAALRHKADLSEKQRRALNRARSHEMLEGASRRTPRSPPPGSAAATARASPADVAPAARQAGTFLTSAVFSPAPSNRP